MASRRRHFLFVDFRIDGQRWRYEGDPKLLDRPRVALVHSAAGRAACASEPWVDATVRAVQARIGPRVTQLCSLEPFPWTLALYCAARSKGGVVVALPGPAGEGCRLSLAAEFGIAPERLGVWVPEVRERYTRKEWWRRRDALIWQAADVVLPIAIRPGGRWDTRLKHAGPEKGIDRTFQVEIARSGVAEPIVRPPLRPDDEARSAWIVHWTRRCHGPWPGESRAEYCARVLAAPDPLHHSAAATLDRILSEGRMRASTFRSSGGVPVVSFSGASPAAWRANFRWCARRGAPMWEPWGIAVRREAAPRSGIHPVNYGEAATGPSWLRHGGGPFTAEQEWRHRGDLNLLDLNRSDWCVVTPADWGSLVVPQVLVESRVEKAHATGLRLPS